jgi:endogenous inhibitor of DNA gyrase (YacG/DUF329 family)
VTEEVLISPCPICGKSALGGSTGTYACPSCGTQVQHKRWLGIRPRNQFLFTTIGADYSNLETELLGHPFTKEQLARLAGTCYTDADLAAIAAGDLGRLRLPASTLARIMFPQSHETCYIQVNGLTRAEGPPVPDGVDRIPNPVDKRNLQVLDKGNLFISDQRLIFPSSTHTTIRIDRKLTAVRTFTDAIAVQRKGEDKATYWLGTEPRHAALIVAYLQGQLQHLR